MGEVVGAAIVSHHPGLFRQPAERIAMGNGRDSDLVQGYARVREHIDAVAPDTLVIFDTHWFTSGRHVIAGAARYRGIYTSNEMPWILHDIPYDYAGSPELAAEIGRLGAERGMPVENCTNAHVRPEYPTVNLLGPLWRGERVLAVGICQNARAHHFLQMGGLIGDAIARCEGRVVLLASGALSHRMVDLDFQARHPRWWDPANISDPAHVQLDHEVMASWSHGDHAAVIDRYPELRAAAFEGFGGHYLQMVGALGGRDCGARGQALSEYENAMGTGNVHIWFDVSTNGIRP
ncbi:MAG: extradiol ring-cleavage dioxygenase [Burkholderiaceae bacterium]